MAPKIMKLAEDFLRDPVKIEIAPESSTVDTVEQSLYTLRKEDKKHLLLHMLKGKEIKNAVVFTKTKHGANKVEKILLKD
jgi:ATP-dependent RNA helicase RhlE